MTSEVENVGQKCTFTHKLTTNHQCLKWGKKVSVLSCIGKSWHLKFLHGKTKLGNIACTTTIYCFFINNINVFKQVVW